MKYRHLKLIIYFAIILLPSYAFAEWVGPAEIIKVAWGKANHEVGFEHSQYGGGGGGLLGISRGGLILVGDAVNCRINLFDQKGIFLRNVYPKGIECPEDLGWPEYLRVGDDGFVVLGDKFQKYDFEGNLVFSINTPGFVNYFIGPSGKIYYQTAKNAYQIYSTTGELLIPDHHSPLELGVERSSRSTPDGLYEQVIEYDDLTFTIKTKGGLGSYSRDANGLLYGISKIKGNLYPWRYRIYKFDRTSKQIAFLDFPENKIHEETHGLGDAPTSTVIIEEEYGPPIVGSDGSVYCWKQTPDSYSILKWVWK